MAATIRDRPGMTASASDSTRTNAAKPGGETMPALCGDIDMRIARDGTWFYHGSPIGRKPLAKLFASVLRRESDGNYYLVTPVERCLVRVDDAPFVAVEVNATDTGPQQELTFRTNLDDLVNAGPDHPIRVVHNPHTGEPTPYIHVRDRLEALIARPVYYELVDRGVEATVDNKRVFGVWSRGAFFALGPAAERS
jgi:hypothetical protein